MDNVIRCPCCLTADSSTVKIDRRGAPYLTCGYCKSRTFVADHRGLAAIIAAQPAIAQLVARAGGTAVVQREAAATLAQATKGTG